MATLSEDQAVDQSAIILQECIIWNGKLWGEVLRDPSETFHAGQKIKTSAIVLFDGNVFQTKNRRYIVDSWIGHALVSEEDTNDA